jgi:uncharacterized protein YkwD
MKSILVVVFMFFSVVLLSCSVVVAAFLGYSRAWRKKETPAQGPVVQLPPTTPTPTPTPNPVNNTPAKPKDQGTIPCPDPGCDVIVSEHNRVRRNFGVTEPLVWDAGLQEVAQTRVDWNAAHGETGHAAVGAGIAPSTGGENAYSGLGFGTGPGGAAEMWAHSVGHHAHVIGRNVKKVGCATNAGAGKFPSICVYDAWGDICNDTTICAHSSNPCRCDIDEHGGKWGCNCPP